jgi:hypothetical protein
MKRLIVSFSLSFLFLFSYSQTLTDVARSKELTWYGVDFTQAKFIGYDKTDVDNCSFNNWDYTELNNLESDMIRGAYGKKQLYVETSTAKGRNDTINCNSLFIDNTYTIKIEKIKQVIDEYKITGNGYGVLLIVETIEKTHNNIFVWVIYIDNNTGKVINSRRYIGGEYGRKGNNYSKEGIKLVIKLSGKDLKKYK